MYFFLTTSSSATTTTNNSNTKTIHMGLQTDAYKNIDGQNNKVTKELLDSTLMIESFGSSLTKQQGRD